MLVIQGYYNGTSIIPLEEIRAKPNQRVIITVLDEYFSPVEDIRARDVRGIIHQYANAELREKEPLARTVTEKGWDRHETKPTPVSSRVGFLLPLESQYSPPGRYRLS